jgi:hypothetical protein
MLAALGVLVLFLVLLSRVTGKRKREDQIGGR